MHDDEIDDDDEIEIISKSQIKREFQALQDLGRQLVELSDSQLARLPLTPDVLAAIEASRSIKQHIARKRHLKYLGKLMREVDETAVQQGLDALRNQDKVATARFHRMEQWRDRLIGEGDGVLAEFIDEYPTADRQKLRQLIRNAQKEAAANKPPKSSRLLFKEIRALMEGH